MRRTSVSSTASSPPTVSSLTRRKSGASVSPANTSSASAANASASSPQSSAANATTPPPARRPSQASPGGNAALPPTSPPASHKSPSASSGASPPASQHQGVVYRTTISSSPSATFAADDKRPPLSAASPRRPAAAVVILDGNDANAAPAAAPHPPSPPRHLLASPYGSILIAKESSSNDGGAPPADSRKSVSPPADHELSSSIAIAANSTGSSSAIAHFTEQETKYFRKMFAMFDTDHSGAIGYFEMKNLARHLGVQISDEQLRVSIDRVDENGNGELEFEEFLQWLANVNDNADGGGDEFAVLKSKIRAQGARPLTSRQIEQFRAVFLHFDTDGSGTIDIEELGNVFEAMGQSLSTEELQSVLRHADDDGSGEIDFDEFLLLMCSSFGAEESFEGDLMDTFRRYDVDADGLISTRDLRQLVVELVGDSMTSAEVDEVVEVAAVERGDGYIEFMKWESLWDACRGIV